MSYKALYRTYRPSSFDDVVGQKHVVATLQNAVKQNKIAHAYLFCGPRGTGKTSIVRRLCQGTFEDRRYVYRFSDSETKKYLIDRKNIIVRVFDPLEIEIAPRLTTAYFMKQCLVIMIIFDLTNRNDFQYIDQVIVNTRNNFDNFNLRTLNFFISILVDLWLQICNQFYF